MAVHHVKSHTQYFTAMWEGDKTAELRNNDRNYKVDDTFVQYEFNPEKGTFTGRVIAARISHITLGEPWLNSGYVMLSLRGLHMSYNPLASQIYIGLIRPILFKRINCQETQAR